MSLFTTGVRKPFAFLPPIAWALIIDALDFFPNVVNTVLAFFGVGFVIDFAFDVVQTAVALVIFEDAAFSITNVDFVLPPGFDIFPAYTAKILAHDFGLVK